MRELRNAVERAMLLSDASLLTAGDFQVLAASRSGVELLRLPAGGVDIEELERDLVAQALRRAAGNRSKAAALLGMNRDQIRYRIDKFHLEARLS